MQLYMHYFRVLACLIGCFILLFSVSARLALLVLFTAAFVLSCVLSMKE